MVEDCGVSDGMENVTPLREFSSRYSSPNANFVRVGGNSRGNFEADGLEQCIQVVSDALI